METESENIEKRKREKAEVRLMRKRAAQQFSVDRLKMKEKAMRELGTNPLSSPNSRLQPCPPVLSLSVVRAALLSGQRRM